MKTRPYTYNVRGLFRASLTAEWLHGAVWCGVVSTSVMMARLSVTRSLPLHGMPWATSGCRPFGDDLSYYSRTQTHIIIMNSATSCARAGGRWHNTNWIIFTTKNPFAHLSEFKTQSAKAFLFESPTTSRTKPWRESGQRRAQNIIKLHYKCPFHVLMLQLKLWREI